LAEENLQGLVEKNIQFVNMPFVASIRKVAIVSRNWTAHVYRLMLGALSYAEVHPNIVTRDFRIPRDFTIDDNPGTAVNQLRKWNPDGLLCFLTSDPMERLVRSLPQSRPIVNTCDSRPIPGMARLLGSQAKWIETCVRHLRQQGFRSVAYLLLEQRHQHKFWIDLFNEKARPANPSEASLLEVVNPLLLEDPEAPVAPVPPRLAAWLLNLPRPVGVFCPSLGGGGYLIRVCHELGLRVPEDVAVVGSDDTDLALACNPSLTTVVITAQKIGHEAMHLLDQMLNGAPAPAEAIRLEAMDLHVRESTGLRRAEICDLAAALEYINQHACHGISVEQLMKETQNVSKVTFHKHFLAATGQTPGDAIQQRQLEEARRLLGKTELSITAIAENCGFDNSSNFARRFHALQGMTPRDYRKQSRLQRHLETLPRAQALRAV
jgi:LacI family transcriptional regulator